jgi:hypothetical protein
MGSDVVTQSRQKSVFGRKSRTPPGHVLSPNGPSSQSPEDTPPKTEAAATSHLADKGINDKDND